MTYATGQIIASADFTAFRGNQAPDTSYASNSAATAKLAALIGVGYGTRGYGQTSTVMPGSSVGGIVTAAQWNGLINAISTINTHTGSGYSVPTPVTSGSLIRAFDGSAGRPDLPTLITNLDSNRLNYSLSQMGLSSVLSSSRTSPWSVSVTHEFTATFPSENLARYFFNTGGQVYAVGSRSGGSASTLNSAMTTILANMGTIKFGAQATTYTGSGGTVYPIGYYNLTGAYQTLFHIIGGAYPYSYGYGAVSYTLKAKAESIAGLNGGNGSVVRFQAVFATGVSSYSTVSGTLTSAISQLKSGGVLSITAPTYATTIPL